MSSSDRSELGQHHTITLELELQHPPEKVWRALTEPSLLAEWLLPLAQQTLALEPGAAGTRLAISHIGFKPHQKQAVGGARYGWRMMTDRLTVLLEESANLHP